MLQSEKNKIDLVLVIVFHSGCPSCYLLLTFITEVDLSKKFIDSRRD